MVVKPLSSARQKKSSLHLITLLVMVSAALVFSGYGAFSYHWQQDQLEREIIGQTKESASRLASTLSPYIETYQINEYDKLMSHEIRTLNHSALSAIVVDDYKMGAIMGKEAYTTGWLRNEEGSISIDDEAASEERLRRHNLYLSELAITGAAGDPIGRVRVYANDQVLKTRSRALLTQIVVSMLVLMLVLSFVLILLLKHLFIRPLQTLAAAVEPQGTDVIPQLVEPVSPYREISLLTDAMAQMLQTIRKTQDALHKEHQSLEHIVEGTRAGTWSWNIPTGAAVFNERWAEMLGYRLEELEPVSIDTWRSLVHPDDLVKSEKLIEKHFSGENDYYECEVRVRHKAGHWIWVQNRGRVASWGDDGQPLEMFGTHLEITKIKEYQEQLRHIAHYDMLTGLPNRVLLFDRLGQALERAKGGRHDLAVFFIDLDGFKEVNDQHGHDAGDFLLVEIASRLASVMRTEDTLARLGGDEFVAVLPGVRDRAQLKPILNRILQKMNDPVVMDNGTTLKVSASIGVTLFAGDGEVGVNQLVTQADQAMYQAKMKGKNNFCFSETDHEF